MNELVHVTVTDANRDVWLASNHEVGAERVLLYRAVEDVVVTIMAGEGNDRNLLIGHPDQRRLLPVGPGGSVMVGLMTGQAVWVQVEPTAEEAAAQWDMARRDAVGRLVALSTNPRPRRWFGLRRRARVNQ